MEHLQARELLGSYLDGELAPDDAAKLTRHIRSCAACRADLAGLRYLHALLRSVPEVDPPRNFTLARPPAPVAPRWLRPVRYATAVAAILLLALLGGDLLTVWLDQGAAPSKQAISALSVTATPGTAAPASRVAPETGPLVAGAEAQRDPNQALPRPVSPPANPEEARPPSGFRAAEYLVGIVLFGLLAAWVAGRWLQRSVARPR